MRRFRALLFIAVLTTSSAFAAVSPHFAPIPVSGSYVYADPEEKKELRSDSAVRIEIDGSEFGLGESFLVDLILENVSPESSGPFDIFGVVTTLTVPTGLSVNSVTPGFLGSCSFEGQVATCTHISFPANSTETASVNVTSTEAGFYTITGETTHDGFDPVGANNIATESVTIVELTSSISGVVYDDKNADGILDPPGEVGLGNVSVTLSGAGSGVAVTSANGAYSFTGLDPGEYVVTVTKPGLTESGAWHFSNPESGSHSVSLGLAEDRTLVDFLIWNGAVISFHTLHDLMADGSLTADPGIAGVNVLVIDDCVANILETSTTLAGGENFVSDLRPGEYCLRVDPNQPFPGTGVGTTMDVTFPAAIGLNLPEHRVVVESGSSETVFFAVATTGKISGTKFIVDGNGVTLPDDARRAGWTITLKDNEGQTIGTAVTGADGTYVFDEVEPGNYEVTETVQDEWKQILPDEEDGFKHSFELNSDVHESGQDFVNQFQDADVAASKSFSPSVIAKDDTVTVTIVVSNVGTTPAENVAMQDVLTNFFDFVSVSSTAGTCSEADRTIDCSFGTMAPGQSETVTVITVAVLAGETSNVATATTSSEDRNDLNDISAVNITIHPVDLTLALVTVKHQTCIKGILDVDSETTDGNRVIITVSVTNGSLEKAEFVVLNFKEFASGKILNDGTGVMSGVVQAGTTRIFEYTWNTTGWAWNDNETPHVVTRLVHVELFRGGESFGTVQKEVKVKPKPVILVHGLWSNAAAWGPYPAFAEAQHANYAGRVAPVAGMDTGLFPIAAFLEPTAMHQMFTKTTISQNSASLDAHIDAVRSATNSCHVDLVGHSMGGLISRHWIHNNMDPVEADGERLARHLVQLGSPNEGSPCTDDIMAMYPKLVADDNSFSSIFQQTRPPNNIIELTTSHMIHTFNQQVTNYKGVPIYLAYGDKVPFTCRSLGFGDGVVTASSALATQTSNPTFTSIQNFTTIHTSMPGHQGIFDGYVKPILAEPPGGGPLGHNPDEEEEDSDVEYLAKGQVDGQEYILTARNTVQQNEELVVDLPVGLATSFGVTYLTASAVTSSLFDPSGAEVESIAANSEESLAGLRAHTIENPTTGTWQIKFNQSEADSVGLLMAAWVIGSDVTLSLSVDLASEVNHVLVASEFLSGISPITGATVSAVAVAEEGTAHFPLNDDGQNGDLAAGDGVYSALFRPEQPGTFLFSVDAVLGSDTRTTTINQDIQGISGVGIERQDDVIPTSIAVGSVYPNPARHSASLPFLVSEPAYVDIRLYDLLGKETKVLSQGQMQPGSFEAQFDSSDLPSGQYIIRARIGDRAFTRLVSVIK